MQTQETQNASNVLGHNYRYLINSDTWSDITISQYVEAQQLCCPSKWLQQKPIAISLTKVMLGWTPNKT